MPFLHELVHHPRKLLLRRVFFQIHLWTGIALSLYMVVIAVSGSLLVFEDDLTGTTLPAALFPYDPAHIAPIPEVMRQFAQVCRGCTASYLIRPYPAVPAFQITATDAQRREVHFIADPTSGAVRLQPRTWVDWVHDLHLYLLLGSAHGEQVNGVGAIVLLVLCVTGLVLWWQGIRNWTRALGFSFRHNWRRINFDLHHAIGFWTIAILCWWGISGVYFGWYRQFEAAVNAAFPLKGMLSPEIASPPSVSTRVPLAVIVASAEQASPHGRLFGLSDPSLAGTTLWAQMDLRAPGDFSHRDIVTLDATDGRVLAVWHYGQNQTLGDWIMWSMHPLHFGTLWGLPFRILWFLLGIALAALSVTGLLMYWNRYLRHRIP